MRLLYAEDEKPLSEAVVDILTFHKYTVDAVYDGEAYGALHLLLLFRQFLLRSGAGAARHLGRRLRRVEVRRQRAEHLPVDDRLVAAVRLTLGTGRRSGEHRPGE